MVDPTPTPERPKPQRYNAYPLTDDYAAGNRDYLDDERNTLRTLDLLLSQPSGPDHRWAPVGHCVLWTLPTSPLW
jgi:hypothetical protein